MFIFHACCSPCGCDALSTYGNSGSEQACASGRQATHDCHGREANETFCHARCVQLGSLCRHALAEKSKGALDIAEMQVSVSQTVQSGCQIAHGADLAKKGDAFLINSLRLGVLMLMIISMRYMIEYMQIIPEVVENTLMVFEPSENR